MLASVNTGTIIAEMPYPYLPIAVVSVLLDVIVVIYAVIVYPSYYDAKGVRLSVGAQSFLNGFFGGPIFCPLLNASMTSNKRGVAHIVLAVIAILDCVELSGKIGTVVQLSQIGFF